MKINDEQTKENSRAKMTVKLLEKYMVWKKTKCIIMDHMYAANIPNL